MKKKVIRCIPYICCSISIVVFSLDFLNLPSHLGIEVANVNWDLNIGLLTNLIVVTLFSITYEILDKRTVEKEKNKEEISTLLLKESYDLCLQCMDNLSEEFVKKFIVPKMDFDGGIRENQVVENLKNAPFLNESIILSLAIDGQVSPCERQNYYKIKQQFREFIMMQITFYDSPKLVTPVIGELKEMIGEAQKALKICKN